MKFFITSGPERHKRLMLLKKTCIHSTAFYSQLAETAMKKIHNLLLYINIVISLPVQLLGIHTPNVKEGVERRPTGSS